MNLKSRLKRFVYGSCPGLRGSFPYFGTQVYFPKRSHIFERACKEQVYEKENLRLMAALVRPETYYFDVGANIGLLSVPILRCHDSCRALSFEPSPNSLPFLRRTLQESPYRNRWQVIEKAVGRQPGSLEFHAHSADHGGFDSLRDTGRAGNAKKFTVPVTTLDWEWQAAGTPSVSLIKIDVEGAEMEALRGAMECIRARQPSILVEWNQHNLSGFDCSPASLLDFAAELEYAVFSLPNLERIQGATHLQLQMLRTESFLLAPAHPPENWRPHYASFPGLRD